MSASFSMGFTGCGKTPDSRLILFAGPNFSPCWPCFAAVFSFCFAPGGRFIGLHAHFGPNRPAIQSKSVSAYALNSAPRWSADRTNPLDPGRALAGLAHGIFKTLAERRLGRQLRNFFRLHSTIRAAHPVQLHHHRGPVLEARRQKNSRCWPSS